MSTPSQVHGTFSWMELHSNDARKAQAFYSDLFGWGSETVDMGMGPYTMIANGEDMLGGYPLMETDAPRWLPYVTVDDVDVRVEKARELGATIASEPMSVPKVGRMATIVDPVGGVIAMITYERPDAA